MNKVAGIGVAVIIIAVIIVAAMSFSNDSDTSDSTIRQSGPFTIESSQEISEEKTAEGINHSIILTEKVGVSTQP